MSLALALASLLAAAPIGAPTSLELVKNVADRFPDLLQNGPGLTSVLATKAEVTKVMKSMKLPKDQTELFIANALADQTVGDRVPASFSPTAAILAKDGETPTFFFYDATSRIRVGLVIRGKGKKATAALMLAPSFDTNSLDGDVLLRRSGAPSERKVEFFSLKDGAWVAGPLPTVSAEACLEMLRVPARVLAASEARFFEANKTYVKSFGALDYEFTKYVVLATVRSADASHFTAEIKMYGGTVRIDETNKPIDVQPCSLAP